MRGDTEEGERDRGREGGRNGRVGEGERLKRERVLNHLQTIIR